MNRYLIFLLAISLGGFANAAERLSFNRDVRPILSDKCYKCHGPDSKNQKSDFRIDTFEQATKTHDDYAGIVPGNLEDSEVHWRLHSDDPDDIMPPPEAKMKLTKAEVEILDRWITEGAEYEKHWSFKPLPEVVELPETVTSQTPIDSFIQRSLASKGLETSPEVSPEKWLRRVTFDLTGLPPTLDEIDQFLADTTEAGYAKVVDRLLKSSAYAERMTAEWLDVARYSDSYGYQVDRHRNVWPWRDWVIRAFQQNLSYDDFITWQIAGDLLPKPTQDQVLATAFNRLHSQKVEGGSVEEEFRVEYVTDRVHTFATAFLGLTMECTRCHDHKYDPLTMTDYYSMSAFFANIDEAGLYAFFNSSIPTPTIDLPAGNQRRQLQDAKTKLSWLELRLKNHTGSAAETPVEKLPDTLTDAGLKVHLDFEGQALNHLVNRADEKSPARSSGGNQFVPGKVGQGMKLSGDDAVNLAKGVGNFSRDQPFSVALWMNTPTAFERAVVYRRSKAWTDAASRGYELLIENGKLSAALVHFWPGNALRIESQATVPLNQWQHVAVTYDGSSRAAGLQMYINGKLAKTKVVRDNLTREITGGDDFIGLGERMRDKGFKNGLVDEFRVYDREITSWEIQTLFNPDYQPTEIERKQYHIATVDPNLKQIRRNLQAARKAVQAIKKKIPEIMVMKEMPGEPRQSYILNRGLYSERGEKVVANTPAVLPPLGKDQANRLDLAKWLVSSDHPLTARVAVNRYWQMMFGNGLVSTGEDFGSQGKLPSHPELLDWLARDFVGNGWDLHRLLKQMALSATYRQSANMSPNHREIDPENIWLARGPTYKLPAEMIRDNALAVSGLISGRVGGPSVRPYDLAAAYKPSNPDKGENLYRRSIYTYWQRTAPSPMMMILDSSKKDVCRVKREETASPLQSLVLLNSPQFIEAARVTAENLLKKHGGDDAAIVAEAFRLLVTRLADEREKGILLTLIKEQTDEFSSDLSKADRYFKTGDKAPAADIDKARLAAVTVMVSTLMNFDESITKR